ncbi:MAG: DNA internalization-related competence protein ComEC/Rec2 [Desulfobacteraceae bacterium 4572_87]|nr:MAG: DNA internalization-related competence protein ComEC/Rec2 [Desulfobacteraceae bacterium 4572_87]
MLKPNSGHWALKSDAKKDRPFNRLLFNRPLVPCLISFTGGILTAHAVFPARHTFFLPILLALFLCLLLSLFCLGSKRAYLLLAVFFLIGIFLTPEKRLPSRLRTLAVDQQKVIIEGVVLEPPKQPGSGMTRAKVLAQNLISGDNLLPLNENIIVTVYRNAIPLRPGEKIRFPARLRTFKSFQNPGHYDYEKSMTFAGFTCAAAVSDGRYIVPMGPGKLPLFQGFVERLQSPVRAFFNQSLNHQNAVLFRALILGERQGIEPNLREAFNRSGLGHLLAVSGLHIGLVAWAAFFIFKWLLSRSYRLILAIDIRKWGAFLTCFPVIGYTLLAGCRVSSQRAMIMILAYLLSLILGKEKEVWSTLALAGLVILFLDPGSLFTPSFQLSFLAVTGILWLTPSILRKVGYEKQNLSENNPFAGSIFKYFIGLAAVSVSAVYFLLPVTALYFHRIPLVSLPANLTTIPILGLWVLPLGLLSVLTLPFSWQLAGFFLHTGAWGLNIMMDMVWFWSGLSWASIWSLTPNFFEIGLFYLFTFFAFFAWHRRWARLGLVAIVFLIIIDVAYWVHRVQYNRDLEVVFLDVGKGNAALVSFPGGEKMMIDGGGFSSNHFDVGKMVIAPFLWHRKIGTIDILALSHPQADHMNGLRFIAETFHPKEFWYNGDSVETPSYKDLMRTLEAKDIAIKLPAQLQKKICINGAEIEVLYPKSTVGAPRLKLGHSPVIIPSEGRNLNNRSMVLRISYAGKSILFPGDLEGIGEKGLLTHAGSRVKSDILLSPHHGSRTSSTKAFLEAVAPRLCVISSGEDRFGRFPHPSVLKRLAQMECESICISDSGAVTVKIGHERFDIHSFLSKNFMKN